ncbi:hypothetical protein HJ01_00052 [Flavobacterium frigoris PS1]|uniref:Uncharacterized protein n=1 Tax=Flavobacterium frigoris (strain PS1) TaxID=1086011 RepID=H7FLK4_FLAFP|nr:hypothetical protein HJ01_00052 [Flavobacterium frigoris PS1]
MIGYGSNGLIREGDRNNKMFFYIGGSFVVTLFLLGLFILIFVLRNHNNF